MQRYKSDSGSSGVSQDHGRTRRVILLEPLDPSDYALSFKSRQFCRWKCLVGNSKKWKEGEIYCEVDLGEGDIVKFKAERIETGEDGSSVIDFYWNRPEFTFGQLIEAGGEIPIPPYLNRESEESDKKDYQTVYAEVKGSVAAPTAGLHFTPQVFEGLDGHGIPVEKVTLHVGAGTFRPVKSDTIGEHAMHSEPFSVSKNLIEKIIEWKIARRPVVAVGTTTVRTLESLPYIGMALGEGKKNPFVVEQWTAYDDKNFETITALRNIVNFLEKEGKETFTASTSIMIAPGFKWRIVDAMVTNFHQPKSTLLLLVSSFLDGDSWREVYREALANAYRFLSYGDASLLLRQL